MIRTLILSLPMFVCGIVFVELLFSQLRHRDGARSWLMAWAATATLLYAMHLNYFYGQSRFYECFDTIYVVCNLLVYPLYLIYIYKLTDLRPLSSRRWELACFIGVPVLMGGLVGTMYLLMSQGEREVFQHEFLYHGRTSSIHGLALIMTRIHQLCRVLFAVFLIVSCIFGIRQINRFNHSLEQFYADTEQRHMGRQRAVLWALMVCSIVSFVVNLFGRQHFESHSWTLYVLSVLFSVMLLYIGWLGLTNTFSIIDMHRDLKEPTPSAEEHEETKETEKPDDRYCKLMALVQQTMDEDHYFLQNDLNLNTLALHVGTNRTYLLQAIRQCEGVSFSEYINRQRIAYAERLKAEYPEMHAEELAQRSGFSSVSAYYMNRRRYAHHSEKK